MATDQSGPIFSRKYTWHARAVGHVHRVDVVSGKDVHHEGIRERVLNFKKSVIQVAIEANLSSTPYSQCICHLVQRNCDYCASSWNYWRKMPTKFSTMLFFENFPFLKTKVSTHEAHVWRLLCGPKFIFLTTKLLLCSYQSLTFYFHMSLDTIWNNTSAFKASFSFTHLHKSLNEFFVTLLTNEVVLWQYNAGNIFYGKSCKKYGFVLC